MTDRLAGVPEMIMVLRPFSWGPRDNNGAETFHCLVVIATMTAWCRVWHRCSWWTGTNDKLGRAGATVHSACVEMGND